MPELISVKDVRKHYARVRAVDGLSFSVQRGEIFALLGPNGAGKTTMVRMLLGIIPPDSGEIAFFFEQGGGELTPERIGYLPEERGLYPDLPLLNSLLYIGSLRGMSEKQAREKAMIWLERLELTDRANDKLQTLSKGNQQKVQFIAAVLHQPPLAVLDEPFSGLDPVNQTLFLELLQEMKREGMTILLSAHQMNLVERIADRILLIDQGRAVLHGTMEQIRREAGARNRLTLTLEEDSNDPESLAGLEEVLAVERGEGGQAHLLLREGSELAPLLKTIGESLKPSDLRMERMDLHDIYVTAVRGNHSEDEERAGGAK